MNEVFICKKCDALFNGELFLKNYKQKLKGKYCCEYNCSNCDQDGYCTDKNIVYCIMVDIYCNKCFKELKRKK